MKKGKKKSLIGWTYYDWDMAFSQTAFGTIEELICPWITKDKEPIICADVVKPMPPVKVKITIEQLKGDEL